MEQTNSTGTKRFFSKCHEYFNIKVNLVKVNIKIPSITIFCGVIVAQDVWLVLATSPMYNNGMAFFKGGTDSGWAVGVLQG